MGRCISSVNKLVEAPVIGTLGGGRARTGFDSVCLLYTK